MRTDHTPSPSKKRTHYLRGRNHEGSPPLTPHFSQALLLRGLEDKALLGLEGNAELQKLDVDIGELLEEGILVLGVTVNVLAEDLVLDESNIGGQHHQGGGGLVGELSRAIPLALTPLLVDEQLEIIVGEDRGAEVPRSLVARSVGVRTAQGVSTGQGHHLTVIKAHAAEDGADVVLVLGGIRQTPIGGAGRDVLVLTAGSPRDDGATKLLDGGGTGQSPQIRVGDPGELSLDGLQEVTGVLQTGVGTVVRLRSEAHGSTVATTSAGHLIVGTAGVPGETDEDLELVKSAPH